jgi:hypothetical protein
MSEILLCNQPMKADYLNNTCGIDTAFVHGSGCSSPELLSPHTPYVLGQKLTAHDKQMLSLLSTPKETKELTNLSLSFGGDNTMALAEMTRKLHEYNVGLIGASTSVYANRIGGFAGAVKEYQDALMAFRGSLNSNPASKALAKQKAIRAFQNLQIKFKNELNAINSSIKARRGTPLSSSTRATNIAQSSRNVAKLNVASHIEANGLVKFARHAKFLGNGLAVIDFTSRIGNVRNSYQAGGNWERDLFIESSSFVASAGAGMLAVDAGTAALGLLMVATPVGWIGLIVGGIVVAGAAATTSIIVNKAIKDNSGSWYDSIMGAIGVK